MSDLTEQWGKGELPYGRYYVELAYNGNNIIMAEYWWDKALTLDDHEYSREEVKRILAPVPSYDEWKALIDLYKEADVIIKKSDKENTNLKTDCKALAKKLLQVKPELRESLEINYGEYL